MDPNTISTAEIIQFSLSLADLLQLVWAYAGCVVISVILASLCRSAIWESGNKVLKQALQGDCALCEIGKQTETLRVRGTLLIAIIWNELRTVMWFEGFVYSIIFGLLALLSKAAIEANEMFTFMLITVFGSVLFALLLFYLMRIVFIWYCLTVANR